MSRLFVLLYRDTENPRSFPGGYPAESTTVEDEKGEIPQPPWIEMTPEEYQTAIDSFSDQVREINRQVEEKEKQDAANLAQATKDSLQEIEAHAEAVKTDPTAITQDDRFVMVDNLAVTMAKFGPLLEKLLEQNPELAK